MLIYPYSDKPIQSDLEFPMPSQLNPTMVLDNETARPMHHRQSRVIILPNLECEIFKTASVAIGVTVLCERAWGMRKNIKNISVPLCDCRDKIIAFNRKENRRAKNERYFFFHTIITVWSVISQNENQTNGTYNPYKVKGIIKSVQAYNHNASRVVSDTKKTDCVAVHQRAWRLQKT